jgi:hypothetical protein
LEKLFDTIEAKFFGVSTTLFAGYDPARDEQKD